MRLSFRQGIARYQTDVYATPSFLAKSSQTGDYIDLIVSPDPTVIVFAHKDATYIVEESKTVRRAWGPFSHTGNRYLYWDINLLDASLTRGYTHLPPIVAGTAPPNPLSDQHWFDTVNHQMKVWNGSKWMDKIRVFAAVYSSQAIIQPMPIGTQAEEVGEFEAGSLILDSFNKPLRQADGTFLTTATQLSVVNAATRQIKFETEIVAGMADESIPKFSFVQTRPNNRIALARSDNWESRIIGLVTEDLHPSEIGIIQTNGLVKNELWSWDADAVGRPVFCGVTGEITLEPPRLGVNQIAGYVFSRDSILLNIQAATILADLSHETFIEPIGLPGRAPSAEFHVTPSAGTAPLTVTATSTSLHNPTSFRWDFGNDGVFDATTPTAAHTFAEAGTYAIRLRVMNEFGQDEIIKQGVVQVNAPAPTGTKTNLGIQLSGPLQVANGQTFQAVITVSNDGLKTATKVTRRISIDNFNGALVNVAAMPTGSKVDHVNGKLIITLPEVNPLQSSKFVTATLTIVAPATDGVIVIRATVASPEVDSTPADNFAELMVRVK